MTENIENIGELQALVDTGAQRSALHVREGMQYDVPPWNDGHLRGLGGEAYSIGVVNFDLKTEGTIKRMQHVLVFEELPVDLILRADFLLDKEHTIRIGEGSVSMFR